MSFILNSGRFGVTDPGLSLLQSATLWLDASDPGSDSQKAQNKGTGGTALDARLGSTTSVDTNDPLLLTHTGTNYLYLPGVTGNYPSIPDSAALRVTGDIDIRVRVSLDDWTPAGRSALIAKRGGDANNYHHSFCVDPSGTLFLEYGNSSTTVASVNSSVATGHTDGTAYWVRVTRASATGTVTFYTSPDGASPSWSQLGTTVATTAGSINAGTQTLRLGEAGGFQFSAGKLYRAQILDGIGGTTVFDADFTANTNQSSFTESSSNAATVTINRSASGRKAVMVTRPVWLFGTDDYMEIADNALLDFAAADSLTVVAVARTWDTVSDFALVDKRDGNTGTVAGWSLDLNALTNAKARLLILDGSTTSAAEAGTHTAGVAYLFGGQRDAGAADGVYASLGSTVSAKTTDTTTATLANTLSTMVGKHASGGVPRYFEGEIIAVAVFRSALTSTQLGQIATYYGV